MRDIFLGEDSVQVPEQSLPEGALFSAYSFEHGIVWEKDADGAIWRIPWAAILAGADWSSRSTGSTRPTNDVDDDFEAGQARESDLDLLGWVASLLSLPEETGLTLYLKCRGTFGTPSRFEFVTGWEIDRQPVDAGRTLGPLFLDPEGRAVRRMTSSQWSVLEVLRDPPPGRQEDDLRRMAAKIKAAVAANAHGVRLDSYLVNEDVVELEAVAPALVPLPDGSGYRVEPQADAVTRADLTRYMAARGHGPIRIPTGTRGRRTVLVTERAARGIDAIRTRPTLTKADVPRALTDPETFFGPDLDTSAFTRRVVGVGVVTTETKAFSSALEIGGWFEFATSDAEVAPVDELRLDDAERRARICAAIHEAEEQGLAWFPNPFGDGFLQVTAALKAAVCEPEQPEQPERPEKRGLLVKTNETELELESERELQYLGRLAPLPDITFSRNVRLLPHQEVGVRWLTTLAERRDTGALLADDMGLGKTLQILAFLAGLRAAGRFGPHLVVAPVGLLTNWEREMTRFFGDTFDGVVTVQGRARYSSLDLERCPVVLVGYDALRMNELLFARVRWDVVVLDEAQRTKNVKTQISRVVRALHAHFRLASTGTPVENSLDELWAIFDWVMPGLLGTGRDFSENFVQPARHGALDGDWEHLREMSAALRGRLGRYFLRRTKDEVLSLPPLTVQRHDAPLSDAQRRRYGDILAQRRSRTMSTLEALQRLFDVCAHPELGRAGDPHLPIGVAFPKADALWHILDEIRLRDEKAIIFTRRIPIQTWLADEILERYGRRPPIINGEVTSSAERMSIVERFQSANGFRVLVLGPRAAGVGLNITAANHVIHFTREWNPAVENQATDRSYRMGQTRPVAVHHVIVRGADAGQTVEERLDDLLERKRGLMREFVVPLVPVAVEEGDFAL